MKWVFVLAFVDISTRYLLEDKPDVHEVSLFVGSPALNATMLSMTYNDGVRNGSFLSTNHPASDGHTRNAILVDHQIHFARHC